jgi:hypothetical protein
MTLADDALLVSVTNGSDNEDCPRIVVNTRPRTHVATA